MGSAVGLEYPEAWHLMRTPYLVLFAVELTRVLTLPHRNLSLAEVSTPLILLRTVLNKSMEVAKSRHAGLRVSVQWHFVNTNNYISKTQWIIPRLTQQSLSPIWCWNRKNGLQLQMPFNFFFLSEPENLAIYMSLSFETKHYLSNLDLLRQVFWKYHLNGRSFLQEKLMCCLFFTGGNFNKVTVHLDNVEKLIFDGPKAGKITTYVSAYFWYMALINTQMPRDAGSGEFEVR